MNEVIFFVFFILFVLAIHSYDLNSEISDAFAQPMLRDENLIVEQFGPTICCFLTTITFVGDDMLVLEKSGGVNVIRDGILQVKPALNATVYDFGEAGMLGTTSRGNFVYLYFTEATDTGEVLGNSIYKYEWNGEELVNPVFLNRMPSNYFHNGGAMVTGLDGQVYAIIGDTGIIGTLQNRIDRPEIENTSVIMRVDPKGSYYAMGIRNSFGMAIDPVTGNLWATENGPEYFDEINLVPPNFNSGWLLAMGPASDIEIKGLSEIKNYGYGDPKFSWQKPIAPTGIAFANFKETDTFQNSVFVGDCINGNLYQFILNQNRDGFIFKDPTLQDNVVNNDDSLDELIIGTGFGCITDVEVGPDGFLYIASITEGKIFRIMPKEAFASKEDTQGNNPNNGGGCLIATAAFDSELSSQVQQLREFRDQKLLQTELGSKFMDGFNDFYYSFSPIIADYERENPTFKEMIKITITPLITSLSLLNHVSINSETEMLGYGISLIILNVGLYVAVPVLAVIAIKKRI